MAPRAARLPSLPKATRRNGKCKEKSPKHVSPERHSHSAIPHPPLPGPHYAPGREPQRLEPVGWTGQVVYHGPSHRLGPLWFTHLRNYYGKSCQHQPEQVPGLPFRCHQAGCNQYGTGRQCKGCCCRRSDWPHDSIFAACLRARHWVLLLAGAYADVVGRPRCPLLLRLCPPPVRYPVDGGTSQGHQSPWLHLIWLDNVMSRTLAVATSDWMVPADVKYVSEVEKPPLVPR